MEQPTRLFASIADYVGRPDATGASGVFRRFVAPDGAWEHVLQEVAAHYVLVHPTEPNVVLAGTTDGVYRSTDYGATFQRAGFPDAGRQVWSLMVDESDPRRVYAGASPIGVFLSEDTGATWQALADPGVPARVTGPFESRVMRMAQKPGEPATVYAALEFGGAMVSHDGGDTWADCGEPLAEMSRQPHLASRIVSDTTAEGMLDGHALAISRAEPAPTHDARPAARCRRARCAVGAPTCSAYAPSHSSRDRRRPCLGALAHMTRSHPAPSLTFTLPSDDCPCAPARRH
jgi:hypothetical protein